MLQIQYPGPFRRHLKRILKKFPRSEKRIVETIEKLARDPVQGDVYPGFGDLEVRKIRLALPEYRIGKSSGLRLVFLVLIVKNRLVPLAVYQKNRYGSEDEIRRMLIDMLKEIADEL